jgi:hypothetical protein
MNADAPKNVPAKRPRRKPQIIIARLAARLQERKRIARENRHLCCVSLVSLGVHAREQPAIFCQRLIQNKVKPRRAEEVELILNADLLAKDLAAAASKLTWSKALQQARKQADIIAPSPVIPAANITSPVISKAVHDHATKLCKELFISNLGHGQQTLKCGCFQLVMTPYDKPQPGGPFSLPPEGAGPKKNIPRQRVDSKDWVRIKLSPKTAEDLTLIARFSGLNRQEVVAELLPRQDLKMLFEQVTQARAELGNADAKP